MPKASTQRHPASEIDETQVNRDSRRRLLLVTAGFALAAFLITELLHYLLVPDLGPYRERIMAEGGSALILGMLAAKLLHNAYKARQSAMARLSSRNSTITCATPWKSFRYPPTSRGMRKPFAASWRASIALIGPCGKYCREKAFPLAQESRPE